MVEGNRVFTEYQEELLKAALNRIVPAEDDFPGAGDLGLASYLDSVAAESPALTRVFLSVLDHLEITAHERTNRDFGALSPEQQDEILIRLEQGQPDFFDALVQHTYNGYYTQPAVLSRIGHEARPPQPRGYPMKPFDPRLLDNVRRRAPLYREI